MGCLKLAYSRNEETVLRCVWNREKQSKNHVNLYDYGHRFYDPQIGRFTTIDGLAEKFVFMTPFQYASNNPIKNIDLDGLEGVAPPPPGEELEFNREEFEAEGMESENGLRSIEEDNRPVTMEELQRNTETFLRNSSESESNTFTIDPTKSVSENIPRGAGISLMKKIQSGLDESQKTFQTYTKEAKDPSKNGDYSGRTSGNGTPEQNVAKRDQNHHMNETHGPAKLDKSSRNPDAIRGREQQNIKKSGGAQSNRGTSGNSINGVSPKNPKKQKYEDAANKEF